VVYLNRSQHKIRCCLTRLFSLTEIELLEIQLDATKLVNFCTELSDETSVSPFCRYLSVHQVRTYTKATSILLKIAYIFSSIGILYFVIFDIRFQCMPIIASFVT
jgi:hypothetical protein